MTSVIVKERAKSVLSALRFHLQIKRLYYVTPTDRNLNISDTFELKRRLKPC